MDVLASHICTVQDGAQSLEFAIKLMQLVLNGPPLDRINPENVAGLSHMVGAIVRQFAMLHNAFKFDALHLLTILLSSKNTLLHNALRSMANENWTSHVHLGITTVLQNCVVSSEKLQGLLLAESMMSIHDEDWLVEQNQFDDNQIQMQADKCMLLILETARVEVAVLLIELAYAKYEASKSPVTDEFLTLRMFAMNEELKMLKEVLSKFNSELHASRNMCAKIASKLHSFEALFLPIILENKDFLKGNGLIRSQIAIATTQANTTTPKLNETENKHLK